ncbi:MAG: hypothetical protein ACFBSC_03310 [Microcoleaceae cyanobacterium]
MWHSIDGLEPVVDNGAGAAVLSVVWWSDALDLLLAAQTVPLDFKDDRERTGVSRSSMSN